MRDETQNTFADGLVSDFFPLATPNTVLTNCLNGTLLTFNGNEYVLQNDMGNGRVETAYLPSGYVPVGIKEHGGIIYVASYNPITNDCLIGSFPSPERVITSAESSDLVQEINFEQGKLLYTWQVSKDKILRYGDLYKVYLTVRNEDIGSITSLFKKADENLPVLTAYLTVKQDLQYIPITSTDAKEAADNLCFEFIKSNELPANNERESFDDTISSNVDLTKYSLTFPGELYFCIRINFLKSFSVIVAGAKEDNKFTFLYTINYELEGSSNTFEAILIDDEPKKDDEPGYIEVSKSKSATFLGDTYTSDFNSSEKTIYITREFDLSTNVASDEKVTSYKYSIQPCCTCTIPEKENEIGPIVAFEYSGSIDVNLLNSNSVRITKWKYYTFDAGDLSASILLDFSLAAYLPKAHRINNIKVVCFNLSPDSNETFLFEEEISTFGNNFQYQKTITELNVNLIYVVKIICTKEGDKQEDIELYLYIYTTTFQSFRERYYDKNEDMGKVIPDITVYASYTLEIKESYASVKLFGKKEGDELSIVKKFNYTITPSYTFYGGTFTLASGYEPKATAITGSAEVTLKTKALERRLSHFNPAYIPIEKEELIKYGGLNPSSTIYFGVTLMTDDSLTLNITSPYGGRLESSISDGSKITFVFNSKFFEPNHLITRLSLETYDHIEFIDPELVTTFNMFLSADDQFYILSQYNSNVYSMLELLLVCNKEGVDANVYPYDANGVTVGNNYIKLTLSLNEPLTKETVLYNTGSDTYSYKSTLEKVKELPIAESLELEETNLNNTTEVILLLPAYNYEFETIDSSSEYIPIIDFEDHSNKYHSELIVDDVKKVTDTSICLIKKDGKYYKAPFKQTEKGLVYTGSFINTNLTYTMKVAFSSDVQGIYFTLVIPVKIITEAHLFTEPYE